MPHPSLYRARTTGSTGSSTTALCSTALLSAQSACQKRRELCDGLSRAACIQEPRRWEQEAGAEGDQHRDQVWIFVAADVLSFTCVPAC